MTAPPGPATSRPLLLLDVDGPLNAFGGMPDDRPDGYAEHLLMPPSWAALEAQRIAASPRPRDLLPLPVWLNPDHGRQLLALPYELVWATTWEEEANDWIAPLVGLPELPFILWPRPRPVRPGGGSWKTPEIVARVAGRPFAWVDDEIEHADQDWVRQHHKGPALLLPVDARTGLTDGHFAALTAWAQALA